MFIKLFLPVFSLLPRGPCRRMPAPVAILRWPPVFQQAGCGVAAFDEHALLAHDLARKHSFKKPAIQEDIHEKQFDRCRRNDGRADAACPGEQHRR
jgi:hypothetical protein